jgi:BsuBI/PstI restriction endonuclease domain/BsuBI/PstI restriction endonuclease HTH domain
MTNKASKIQDALSILADLGLPRGQRNERSALSLLALLDLSSEKPWTQAASPLMGITPIMDWARKHYDKSYAPNTRETVRRQTMHQFVQAGIALYNPDDPKRPVNSPRAVYQIEPKCLAVLRAFGTGGYQKRLTAYLKHQPSLAARYAKDRAMQMVSLKIAEDEVIELSPGVHSQLILEICEQFGPRFVPGGKLVYVGDTGEKWGYFDKQLLRALGVTIDSHGKMPDVVIFDSDRDWLFLIEAVTSHGPVDAKRHHELLTLFKNSHAGPVFVSAFPNRRVLNRYLEAISWETEVWIADNPSHLIHFNGPRFLGPYGTTEEFIPG